jgi:hypothetical protein
MLPGRDRKPSYDKTPAAALDYELAQEMAAALGRLGRRLERALQALAQFDAAQSMLPMSLTPASVGASDRPC